MKLVTLFSVLSLFASASAFAVVDENAEIRCYIKEKNTPPHPVVFSAVDPDTGLRTLSIAYRTVAAASCDTGNPDTHCTWMQAGKWNYVNVNVRDVQWKVEPRTNIIRYWLVGNLYSGPINKNLPLICPEYSTTP